MDDRIVAIITEKSRALFRIFDEQQKRLWAATEANALGRGGIAAVHQATGLCRAAIRRGIKEFKESETFEKSRTRKPGGGRKKVTANNPTLEQDLEKLISPSTRGCPMNPLQWTTKSLRNIVDELQRQGHSIGVTALRKLLKQKGYSLQANRKTRDAGKDHVDRDAQFCYINDKAKEFMAEGSPVISVDTKKKENIGNYSNKGQEYQPKKQPIETNMHDFPDEELGKAIPYGVYDIENNTGFVNVGITSDTAEFAVNSIERWWNEVGVKRFPKAKRLMVTADCGGSNGNRTRLWKTKLQEFCDKYGLDVTVCHYPPGTSKWNKIEHKLFSFISKNWRGRPLLDMATIVQLISNTKTAKGLAVRCVVDDGVYKTGIKVTDEVLTRVKVSPHNFHGEWNYTIKTIKETE
jgi:transposase